MSDLLRGLEKAIAESDANTRFVLKEAGVEIGRFMTIAEAKEEVRNSWGQGENLLWEREQDANGRRLRHQQFTIEAVKIN